MSIKSKKEKSEGSSAIKGEITAQITVRQQEDLPCFGEEKQ